MAREKELGRIRKNEAEKRRKEEAELAQKRKADADAKSYNTLWKAQEDERKERLAAGHSDEDDIKRKGEDDFDSDEDFM